MKKYRIVTDKYCGYEVQVWRWWFPFWIQAGVNTHPCVVDAERYARRMANLGKVVKVI